MATVADSLAMVEMHFESMPYSWPDNTCVELVCSHVLQVTGHDLRASRRFRRAISRREVRSIRPFVEFIRREFSEIPGLVRAKPKAHAGRGDIVVIDSPVLEPNEMIGICTGNCLAIMQGEWGLVEVEHRWPDLQYVWGLECPR